MPRNKLRRIPKITARARELRRVMTPAEKVLWQRLRNRAAGPKFRRQRPIGPFIADFYCVEAGVVVEIDGEGHAAPSQAARDAARDEWLQARGLTVLRFANAQVLLEPEAVVEAILEVCSRGPHP